MSRVDEPIKSSWRRQAVSVVLLGQKQGVLRADGDLPNPSLLQLFTFHQCRNEDVLVSVTCLTRVAHAERKRLPALVDRERHAATGGDIDHVRQMIDPIRSEHIASVFTAETAVVASTQPVHASRCIEQQRVLQSASYFDDTACRQEVGYLQR